MTGVVVVQLGFSDFELKNLRTSCLFIVQTGGSILTISTLNLGPADWGLEYERWGKSERETTSKDNTDLTRKGPDLRGPVYDSRRIVRLHSLRLSSTWV